ncbi:hypothetical protein KY332_03150 [Candidatus Woesearchaeota archaeon]|nr:hypothetical protein [Candidatus Woesearchaeota archaeon]
MLNFRGLNCPKGQIKMFESIAVLVVFFILLMFGLMFYSQVQKASFQREMEQIRIEKAIDTAQRVFFLPELNCIGTHDVDCLDELKLENAESIIKENSVYYQDIFGFSNVEIQKIYPESIDSWQLYDVPRPKYTGIISVQFPVSLYDPIEDLYSFGILYIDVYK